MSEHKSITNSNSNKSEISSEISSENPNKDKNHKDEYFLNYLNADINDNGNESDCDSNFIPNDESSIEDIDMSMSQELDTSQEDAIVDAIVDVGAIVDATADATTNATANAILPPVSDCDDSIVDVDLSENLDIDIDMDNDADDEEDARTNYNLRSAAAGSYLSMDNTGNVVRSFSKILRSLSQGEDQDQDDGRDEDERSISSVPRTSLPRALIGTKANTYTNANVNANANTYSALLLHDGTANDQDQDLSHDSSFLLPPPDAMDYAPAEVPPPQPVVQQDVVARLQPQSSSSASASASAASFAVSETDQDQEHRPDAPTNSNANTNTSANTTKTIPPVTHMTRDEHDRLRAEEEDAATKLLHGAATAESPPPKRQHPPFQHQHQHQHEHELFPADHYSHLLRAYEFVEDPSIPPLPPPPREFVQSPTDESHYHLNDSHQSPNTSYEDDIEVGVGAEQEDSSAPRRFGMKGLLAIFSPPVSKPNKGRGKGNDKGRGIDGTPNTEPPSPAGNDKNYSGRQLFHSKNNNNNNNGTSFDEGYEGESDGSTVTRRKLSRKRRRFWTIVVVVLALLCVAATSVIAYTMSVQSRNSKNSNNNAAAVVVDTAGNPSQAGANTTDNDNTNNDNNEWVTTTPPFVPNAASLRPVTIKHPTVEPTKSPTLPPTISPRPTAAPVPTMPPTNEGDFVGRLQALLQTNNVVGPNGQPFVFDFSTNDSLNDPSNLALVYLAREVAATMGLSSSSSSSSSTSTSTSSNSNSNSTSDEPEMGSVVVTVGDEPVVDPNFAPIALKDYDDEKLVQRFALLTLQFGASSSDTAGNPFAGGDKPMKRIVFQGDALADATGSSNGNNSSNSNASSQASKPIDPSTLADPNDARFLVDECDWEGVECATKDNTTSTSTIVTQVRWDHRDLDGSIASTLGLLTALTSLDMSNNNLEGSIPESMYKLTDLEEIILFKNGLTGTISKSIGNLDKLTRFHLSHNSLAGTLPSELKSDGGSEDGIRPIEYFNVYSNQLTGTLPTDLRWRRCDYFDVGRNQLEGTLPDDIGDKFIALRHMFLDHNAFSGTFPSSYNTIGNGRLVVLAIESNQLSGVVPGEREIYDNLVQYTLHDNNFVAQEPQNCRNNLLVEFKADCPNVCTCFGRFFEFCERWCGVATPPYWQQQQQQQQWQQAPSRNWSF